MKRKFHITGKCRISRDAIAPDIEKNIHDLRQTDFKLEIRDINGKPIKGAAVRIEQTSSDFDFGCNCLWLGQLGVKNELYEQLLSELFNTVTTTFCLGDMQPQPGVWRFAENSPEIFRRPPSDRVIKFAEKYGLRLKGQPLMAGSWYPQWAREKKLDETEIKELYTDYFKRVAERYSGAFERFDLVNEMFCHTDFPLYTEDVEYVEWAFRTARPIFPEKVKLFINEATLHVWQVPIESGENKYYNLLRRMIGNGNPPDAVGFQFHLFGDMILGLTENQGAFAFRNLYRQIMAFSTLGLPMYISEITIPSCFEDVIDEKLQAEVIEFCYRMFFSIPNMRGILQWNLCDGKAWTNEGSWRGGIVDEFLRRKPAYHALEHLIRREWRTAFDTMTDEKAQIAFRGFSGEYDVTVEKESLKRIFHITSGKKHNKLILV